MSPMKLLIHIINISSVKWDFNHYDNIKYLETNDIDCTIRLRLENV